VSSWSLDGSWEDSWGGDTLTPSREGGFAVSDVARGGDNQSYGPTGEVTDNGAFSETLTALDTADGITMEGWYFKPDNNISGTLFGFGDHDWGSPSLGVYDAWGYLYVGGGETDDRNLAAYDRPDSGCWHHLAAVFPPGFDAAGEPFRFYLDGEEVAPLEGSVASLEGTGLFGEPFRLGTFDNTSGDQMRLDEVRLWRRALEPEEVAARAIPEGGGDVCPGAVVDWEPGPRCDFPDEEALWPEAPSEVRVLTDRVIAVLTDPTPSLLQAMSDHCGDYLDAMEENIEEVDEWWYDYQYGFAFIENKARYWPQWIDALAEPDHYLVAGCGEDAQAPEAATHWPQAIREIALPRAGGVEGTVRTTHAEVIWVSYLELPFQMASGEDYAVRDAWGNRVDFTYDEDSSVSWAIQVDQLGYLPDADKIGYLGAWQAHDGPADLSRFLGETFSVARASDGAVALEGSVTHRMEDPDYEGASVYEMDFSALTEPGEYYLRVPGAGRSWEFTVGQDALGEAFYVHSRGLYHNRCGTDLEAPTTHWTRGDIHQTWRGGFPPDADDYEDHAADGWGFQDASGAYAPYSSFEAIAATATDEPLEGVTGGWHDAADYDRRTYHFQTVQDLLVSYFMFPENFSDEQLDLPSGADGVPDLLNEARWGVDVWLAAQQEDGGVGTWIEATSHPAEDDPGADAQPYYLSLATRNASLHYARHAAMLGRALTGAGFADDAAAYLDSARAAYDFGTDASVRVSTSWEVDGETHSWTEAPEPDPGRRLWALVSLWLATGDAAYEVELGGAAMDAIFYDELGDLWWQNRLFQAVSVALDPDSFPAGWGEDAAAAIVDQADVWASYQDSHAYRRVWWGDTHGYFELAGWGGDVFKPLRPLVAAWRLTGDVAYRQAALHGVSYHHGANGMGRVNTTGLGDHRAAVALHLPSWADAIDEPSPGITIYGNRVGVPWPAPTEVYGLQVDARTDPPFDGVELALMPPPWDNDAMTLEDVGDALEDTIPAWRRLMPLEQTLPSVMEFTVW